MPKILISHPTLSPHEQLVRHYAGLLKLALTREPKELTEDEKMALCLFSDVKMTYIEHPLYPDQAELRPSLTCSVTRLAPGEPLVVLELHRPSEADAAEFLKPRIVNGTVH